MLVNANGSIVPAAEATVPILDHGFLFGDSVYDVVRTVGAPAAAPGRLFTADAHLARLEQSAARIELALPLSRAEFEAELWRTHLARLDAAGDAPAADSYLRLIVTRGVGELTLDPTGTTPAWYIIAKPLPDWGRDSYTAGVTLVIANTQRNAREALDPAIKSGNYLNNVLALMDARRRDPQAAEAILCNAQGFVTECTTSNVFIVRDGVLATPALEAGILEGVTRRLVIEQAGALGIEVEEVQLRPQDVTGADEVFISSTTRNVLPVRRINDSDVGRTLPGPVTMRLMEGYAQLLAKATE